MNRKQWIGAGITCMLLHNGMAQPIPSDTALHTGKLANGFTYYIRHNEAPKKRVQLYLVNKVGSILEDEDQRGMAHFMEHMNFNGTKHYPKNELIDYLQKAGVRFGADLNAYTSFDETVYELPLPTDDPMMIVSGLNIMRDWAHEATLDSTEIEKERGIVLEEGRLGKGAKDRMTRQYLPLLLNHSRYADRLPIGLDEVLRHGSRAVLKRFHHDWYRPDLQALIVVGDVDVRQVEQLVQQLFAGLENPAGKRARTRYTVPLTGRNQFMQVTDKEMSATSLQVLMKHAGAGLHTEEDYLSSMKRNLFNQLLTARRQAELNREAHPSFVEADAGVEPLIGGLDMLAVNVTLKEGQLQQGFEQVWRVLEKIKRYGFTQTELDRVKLDFLGNMERALKERNKTASLNYVKEYQRLFLQEEAAPGIEWEYAFVKAHMGAISLADIRSVTADYLKESDRDILLLAPEKDRGSLPDSTTVAGWLEAVQKEALQPYQDEIAATSLMVSKPKPGRIVAKDSLPALNIQLLTLSNGVKLILKPTSFKNDEIRFHAFAPGGTSLYSDAEYDAAASTDRIISSFGMGDFDNVQLPKVLSGKAVKAGPYISARSQGIDGTTSPADLETALQLVYLEFTKPRKDSLLFDNIISRSKATLENRYADPGNVFNDTMAYVMGHYSYRSSPPTIKKLDRITLDKVYRIYRERFADASNFSFVFVGNFNADSIAPLLAQYLGALPAVHRLERARDLGVHIPAGKITKKVFKGTENKALVRLVFSGDYVYGPDANLQLRALGEVLQIRLLERLREEASEVYSPAVQTMNNKFPKNRFAFIIAFGCAPENVDHLVSLVEEEIATLKEKGAQEADIQKFKASGRKTMELSVKDNGFWLNYLATQYENHDDVMLVQRMDEMLEKITPDSLKRAAKQFLPGNNRIEFVLLPETGTR